MSAYLRILTTWIAILAVVFLSFVLFPHTEVNLLGQIVNSLLILLGLLSYNLYRKDTNSRYRFVFLNFGIYFLGSIANFIYPFIGYSLLTADPYSSFHFYQYISSGLLVLSLATSILFAVFDTLFQELSTSRKYVLTLIVVLSVGYYYYEPMIWDPMFSYKTEAIEDWKAVDRAATDLRAGGIVSPTVYDIAEKVHLNAWKDGKPVGLLFKEENVRRIAEMLPYIEGNNYIILLMRPMHLNVIYMHVLAVIFIFVFFGYQYKNDPPQGAYMEKILFLFLPYCSLEILHYYAYATSSSLESYYELYTIAQYLTIFNLLLLVIFFGLRLSFITSVKGEFYERELVLDSEHISRWRDGIDNLVVRHFLNPKTIHGRLFAPRPTKSKT